MLHTRRTQCALLLTFLCAGCRTVNAPGSTAQPPSACAVANDTARSSISFALAETVDAAHAPVPSNDAERIIFRQLYDTLVTLDCNGRIVPGLAESWAASEGGRVWQFRLRRNSTFWDGQAVTAADVQDSWRGRDVVTTVLDEHHLRAEFLDDTVDASLFAHPSFAVARRATHEGWRIGSGPFRPDTQTDARIVHIGRRDARSDVPASIVFHIAPGADARRSLDAQIDALISDQRAVLDYARALPGYTSTPLPWNLTYALAIRATPVAPPAEVLAALARDAVAGEARASDAAAACVPQQSAAVPATALASSIVYPRDDPTARGIAERIVALAWPVARAPEWLRSLLPPAYAAAGVPIARPVDRPAVLDSLRALAWVVSLPRVSGAGCTSYARFADDPFARALLDSGLSVVPLVDTRAWFIHRSGLGRVVVDGDGVIRFTSRTP